MKISSPGEGLFDTPSTTELPASVGSEPTTEVLTQTKPSIAEQLDAMGPEQRAEAEEALLNVGAGVVEAAGVEVVTSELPSVSEAYVGAGTDQAEAHANYPLSSAVDFKMKTITDKRGITIRKAYAVMPDGSQKRTTVNNMLVERGYDPNAYADHKVDVKTGETPALAFVEGSVDTSADEVTEKVVAERPISSKRFHVEAVSPIEGTAPVVTSRVGKFMDKMSGKVTNIANRVEGAADIRSDTKRMVERQKIALDGMVENAKIERTATRKARNSALIHGNAIARRLGSANRSEIKQLESERLSASFKAIAEARIRKNEKRNRAPGTTSRTDGLRKFGALITNGLEVHAQVKAKAKAEMARTKTERRDARTEFKTQKDRRSSLNRGIFNSGRTLSGAVDSRIGSFSRAGEFASTNESDRIAFDKKRVEAEFKARSEAARQLAKQRTTEQSEKLRAGRKKQVDKFREERQSH